MPDTGITSYGVYLPTLRLARTAIADAHAWSVPALKGLARGERAFCDWDEDTITMGVEAARGCLQSAPQTPRSLTFASTTPVFADLQNASLVAAAANLTGEVRTTDTGGSLRAGTSALITALESPAAQPALVVAADNRSAKPGSVQEMQFGAGSIALGVGSEELIARYRGSASQGEVFVDHFRAADERFDYAWEERWVREEGYLRIAPPVIGAALEQAGVEASRVAHFCMPAIIGGAAKKVAGASGIADDAVIDNLTAHCGDTGSPHPLLMLAAALERAQPGETILVVGFGGGCDAVVLEATERLADYRSAAPLAAALDAGRVESHYTKLLAFHELLDIDFGMRAEGDNKTSLSQLHRARDQVLAFTGGACRACGQVQFPVLATCVNCASSEGFTPLCLADEPARVATWTADRLQYHPSPPLYFGLVQFDNGARVLMEMVDVDPDNFDVGTPLRMTFRIKQKDTRRKLHRYFWKAAPLS